MNFEYPWFLWGAVLTVPGLLFSLLRYRSRLAGYRSLMGPALDVSGSRRKILARRYWASTAGFYLFFLSVVLALAGPRWGYRSIPEYRMGVDVVFALDISRSMEAQDVFPDRLGRAAEIAGDILASAPGIRFAVALGKGNGILAIPLTEDTESINALLSGISSAGLSSRGTDLERLIDAASSAFLSDFPTRRRIILLSDGEALNGSLPSAADRAQEAGIAIIAVGIGTEEGMPVPAVGSMNGEGLRRDDGSAVISFLRPESLKDAAERTGGMYVDGGRADAASVAAAHIRALSTTGTMDGYRRELQQRRHLFLLAALFFLALSKTAERGPGRKG